MKDGPHDNEELMTKTAKVAIVLLGIAGFLVLATWYVGGCGGCTR